MGTTSAALAEYLSTRQPPSVRERLLSDEAFRTLVGLPSSKLLTVGGVASFDQRELFVTVRRVLADKKELSIVDRKGREVLVSTVKDCIVVKSAPGGDPSFEARLKVLMILSPYQEERKQHLNELLDYLGPTGPDFTPLQLVADQRDLSDDEVGTLIAETINGVVPLQARARGTIGDKEASLDYLVPSSFRYYEQFCGPNPGNSEPDVYLGGILSAYRKELLRRDLEHGLDICLLGALRDDISPGVWTEHVADDDLWNAMMACDPVQDPYSLLGALDIALGRQHDERYRVFADEAVARLLTEKYLRPDGNDTHELIPLLANLVLHHINTLEGGALRAPYWKRMCAWMHAGFLARLTLPLRLDLRELTKWVHDKTTMAGGYVVILDLRREPMYRAAEMSSSTFREEIISRLVVIRSRHEAVGHPMPRSSEVDQAVSRLAAQGSPLGWGLPGPLEGHRRPAEAEGRKIPEDIVREVREIFAPDSSEWKWVNLSYLAQYFVFDEDLLAAARDAVKKCDLEGKGEDQGSGTEKLIGACLVAAVHRDVGLAHAIAEKVISRADKVFSGNEVVMVIRLWTSPGFVDT